MAKVRVPLHGKPANYAVVETEATAGAVVGTNLYNADGTLFDPATLASQAALQIITGSGAAPIGQAVVMWELVQNIPANISQAMALADDGFIRRDEDGVWSASAIVNADLADADTDGLAEGATNLYFTDVRARAANQPASKTLAYDGSDRLSVVTDARGTKTMTYDVSDKLTAIAGTGEYPDMTFTYSGDQLTAVTVT